LGYSPQVYYKQQKSFIRALISMTNNGDPWENAIAERVNGILKTELISTDIL
jgi:hypothetical protein